MMRHPNVLFSNPGSTSRLIAEQIFTVIHRGIDHLMQPEHDPMLGFINGIAPTLPSIMQSLKTLLYRPMSVDADGPNVKQVRRELAAEEARLETEHAEKRARLVAEFGPRFDKAQRMDDLDREMRDSDEQAAPLS